MPEAGMSGYLPCAICGEMPAATHNGHDYITWLTAAVAEAAQGVTGGHLEPVAVEDMVRLMFGTGAYDG